jgi:hypothetical protein
MAKKVNIRMTGKDYRKQWNELNEAKHSLIVHVENRLKELVKLYPKATIIDEEWALLMTTESQIKCIEDIERWSAKQQGVQQLKI